MISKHDEIEVKIPADDVGVKLFKSFVARKLDFDRFLRVEAPDHYYTHGSDVVRHRVDPVQHELTVKKRKSERTTRDRHEIDLHFDPHRTTPRDVEKFLAMAGFAFEFTVEKDSHIFWGKLGPKVLGSIVIYDVWRTDAPRDTRRFIEVEAEKGSPCTPETAKRCIGSWTALLQREFGLGDPINESLYEVFSGKRYAVV